MSKKIKLPIYIPGKAAEQRAESAFVKALRAYVTKAPVVDYCLYEPMSMSLNKNEVPDNYFMTVSPDGE